MAAAIAENTADLIIIKAVDGPIKVSRLMLVVQLSRKICL